MAVCHFHPDRQGVGVCIRCRVVICPACCTKVAGVNHCHACLKTLGTRPDAPVAAVDGTTVTALLVLGVCGLAFLGLGWLAQGWLAP